MPSTAQRGNSAPVFSPIKGRYAIQHSLTGKKAYRQRIPRRFEGITNTRPIVVLKPSIQGAAKPTEAK